MMDRIFIVDLEVMSLIGVYPEERDARQPLVVNMVLGCDLRTAGASDKLEDTVDYHQLEQAVLRLAGQSEVELIETLAEQIAALAMEDSRVDEVGVRIDKPGALDAAKAAAVEIVRRR
ncbi:MAG: dihydroneopterin aldolase [Kiritimatiellaceae bacterium TMED266]|nr:MAG: dihydroneopterin aldolase [Kiritimatiellaceae bacterium TMED266]